MHRSDVSSAKHLLGKILRTKPRASSSANMPDVFVVWCILAGALAFATYALAITGIWAYLNAADSTFITQSIVIVFFVAIAWCGFRARHLQTELRAGAAIQEMLAGEMLFSAVPPGLRAAWVGSFVAALAEKGPEHCRDMAALVDVLQDRAHGQHEWAWWVNGLLLKLGLLGTVAGFIIMAFQVSGLESFDISQAQKLLKNMTYGMGIALLTTLVGLIANMILGAQLLMLDRCADLLVSRAVEFAQTRLPALIEGAARRTATSTSEGGR
jgi:CheY-specific phosphatase CheX